MTNKPQKKTWVLTAISLISFGFSLAGVFLADRLPQALSSIAPYITIASLLTVVLAWLFDRLNNSLSRRLDDNAGRIRSEIAFCKKSYAYSVESSILAREEKEIVEKFSSKGDEVKVWIFSNNFSEGLKPYFIEAVHYNIINKNCKYFYLTEPGLKECFDELKRKVLEKCGRSKSEKSKVENNMKHISQTDIFCHSPVMSDIVLYTCKDKQTKKPHRYGFYCFQEVKIQISEDCTEDDGLYFYAKMQENMMERISNHVMQFESSVETT